MPTWNPLDWQGPEFLSLYAVLALLALCAAWLLRAHMPSATPPGQAAGLGTVELGYLSGGRERAADTVAVETRAVRATSLMFAMAVELIGSLTFGREITPKSGRRPAELACLGGHLA